MRTIVGRARAGVDFGRQLDVEATRRAIERVVEICGNLGWSAVRAACRDAEWRERLHRHDPWRDGRQEALAEVRPEQHLVELDAAGRPVVDAGSSRTAARPRALMSTVSPESVDRAAEPGAELELEIEHRLRPDDHLVRAPRHELADRAGSPAYR